MTNALREEHEINFMRFMDDAERFNYICIHKCTLIATATWFIIFPRVKLNLIKRLYSLRNFQITTSYKFQLVRSLFSPVTIGCHSEGLDKKIILYIVPKSV